MLRLKGTLSQIQVSEPRVTRTGETFTSTTAVVYAGGERPYYCELSKGVTAEALGPIGSEIELGLSLRPYIARSGEPRVSLTAVVVIGSSGAEQVQQLPVGQGPGYQGPPAVQQPWGVTGG